MTTANGYTARPTGTGGAPGQRDLVLSSVGNQANVRKSGMVFPRNLPERSWERIGTSLRELTNSSAWWLGDWLVFGESTYGLRRYREAIERTGLDYQTLRNYAWVARRFEQHRRRDGLSFAHHAEVTRLSPPEQDHWLDRAEQRKWSRNELRRAVRAGLAEQGHRTGLPPGSGDDQRKTPQPNEPVDHEPVDHGPVDAGPVDADARRRKDTTLTIELSPGQLDSYAKAAAAHGLPVATWVTQVLDAADRSTA
ncbi:LmbU family transcriptional regulator [Streptomyces tauricus]|uniref:LmbU family transcriptional regulator n=1 Tax=Streptomyces tauricus TaxID=68274 RepID=UPI00387F0CA9